MATAAEKKTSVRTCLACGAERDKGDLVRFVMAAGRITPDWRRILPGRAVYACPTPACLDRFYRLRRFPERFCKGTPPFAVPHAEVAAWVRERAEESLLHFLGLARKSGLVVPGQHAVQSAVGKGEEPPAAIIVTTDTAVRTVGEVTRSLPPQIAVIRWGTQERLGAALGLRPLGVAALTASPLTERIIHYASIANLFSRES